MNVIELSNLTFRWPKQMENLLEIPSLTIKQGEKVFLKGPSGSGKSSLLSLLTGISQPTSGEINLLQQPFSHLESTQRDKPPLARLTLFSILIRFRKCSISSVCPASALYETPSRPMLQTRTRLLQMAFATREDPPAAWMYFCNWFIFCP